MHIGEIARKTGLTAKAIRYYERVALLDQPERTVAGYRRYTEADAERLEFISIAKGAGFTLDEIRAALKASTNQRVNCGEVLGLFEAKLDEIRERLADTQALHDALEHTVDAARRHQLRDSAGSYDCPLIDRVLEERRALTAAMGRTLPGNGSASTATARAGGVGRRSPTRV